MAVTISLGEQADFVGVQAFVADAIKGAFFRPDLSDEQLAENSWIAEISERSCISALGNHSRVVFVARDARALAGFIIVDRRDPELPEIDWLIVAKSHQGKGTARALMNAAMAWIGPNLPIKLGVIHFNERAIAFYKKFGFADTGEIVGRHKIPRKQMIRPAG